eukprot:444580_1
MVIYLEILMDFYLDRLLVVKLYVVGCCVGDTDGRPVGDLLGNVVGSTDGDLLGDFDGLLLGSVVGCKVISIPLTTMYVGSTVPVPAYVQFKLNSIMNVVY